MLNVFSKFLAVSILITPLLSFASAPATATINLVATVPNTCSLMVMNSIDSLALGEAIRTESLERFQIPVQIDCNTPNAKLKAKPISLTSASAPGYQIYYHMNTDLGLNSGLGWINTSFESSAVMAQFPVPVRQEVRVLLEGFKEVSGKTLPAGNYSGYVQLTIGAD
jgi:hypothetical protein